MPMRQFMLIAFALVFLYLLFTTGAPFLLALVVAIFLEPLTQLLMTKARMNRLAASTISSTIFTAFLVGAAALIGMKVVTELTAFMQNVPQYLQDASGYVKDLLERAQSFSSGGAEPVPGQLESWLSKVTEVLTGLSQNITGYLLNFAKGIPNFFVFFIVFLVAVYLFTLSMPQMKSSFLSLFEERSKQQMDQVLVSLRKSVFGFLRAQLLLSVITYIICFVGLMVIGTGYPLAISLLIVVVDILPVLGTGSVIVPWAAYQLVAGDAFTGVGLLLLFIVITVVRRVVEPKILGDAVGIGALSALISLYVGFELVGVIGVFLGPIVVIVFIAARKAGLLDFKIKLD
ncbi:sporulation integral membrane protein YtvI [Cohnella sp. CFH 77786]|uniref:sporulation integral membrane protein YtvI n=1 Tax=Cohnella sp. CFH 77786 TaxID=2662265 RepID=UPI001C60FA62|nr:sporulation integral membrane protein YtvI [Cohnella sp. CFH 77786]MBW5447792.1 sporulation integral membrane protein YtvI [Cohnella sp. CFH 77786]